MSKVRRYSGQLKMELSFNDRSNNYQVKICPIGVRGGEARCERVSVGAPKHLSRAVDSAPAYDSAARAALAFASDRIQNFADSNDRGFAVRRPGRKGIKKGR